MLESVIAFKRAGASGIPTYFARNPARLFRGWYRRVRDSKSRNRVAAALEYPC
jgi:hypothetical protein